MGTSKSLLRSLMAGWHPRSILTYPVDRPQRFILGCPALKPLTKSFRDPHLASLKQQGRSLIELLMVMLIIAALSTVATPSFTRLLTRERVRVLSRELAATLYFAREYAIHTGTRSLVCPTRDGQHCTPDMRWDHGWLVATDFNHDGQPDGPPVRLGKAEPTLHILSSRGRRKIIFHGNGSAIGSNLTLLFCKAGQSTGTDVLVMSNTGYLHTRRASAAQQQRCAQG